jgi:hypothetical protein
MRAILPSNAAVQTFLYYGEAALYSGSHKAEEFHNRKHVNVR